MSVNIDSEVDSGIAANSAAADQDKIAAIQTGDKVGATLGDHMPVKEWMSNLPKNITVGVMDAARNTVDAVNAFGSMLDNGYKEKQRRYKEAGIDGTGPPQPSAQELRMASLERGSATDSSDPNPYSDHTGFRANYQAFRDDLAVGSGPSDEITQSIAQFAVPMLGWSKLLGAQKAISLAGFGAESLTASTALAPHGGRNADLIAQAKTVEGKLGQALNTISPEGTALNAYINYMTDRTGESDAEGRFKNVIDSLVTTASGAALLKTGAVALKAGQELPRYIAENAGAGPVGPGAQVGAVGDLSRPPLRQGADPAEAIYKEQAARDAEVAAAAPAGAKRPPLRQGSDPAEAIFREQASRDADTASARLKSEAPMAAPVEEPRQPAAVSDKATLDNVPAVNSFSRVLKAQAGTGNAASAHDLSTMLESHLPDSDPTSAFYKEVLGRINEKGLDSKVVVHANDHADGRVGQYVASDQSIHIFPSAFSDNKNLVHTFAHEAVHAAVWHDIQNSPTVAKTIDALRQQVAKVGAINKADSYGLTNTQEFAAEAESNPKFRQALKSTRAADGRSVWDNYRDAVAGILGISGVTAASPMFEKLLSQEKPGA